MGEGRLNPGAGGADGERVTNPLSSLARSSRRPARPRSSAAGPRAVAVEPTTYVRIRRTPGGRAVQEQRVIVHLTDGTTRETFRPVYVGPRPAVAA